MPPPFGAKQLRWLRMRACAICVRSSKPDAIIERYYNFGGEGDARGGSRQGHGRARSERAGDRSSRARRRRWSIARSSSSRCGAGAIASVSAADLIVTPSAAILPPETPAAKIVRLEWGADTERFRPGARRSNRRIGGRAATVAIFAGAFRTWHGAIHLVARRSRDASAQGRTDLGAVFVGDGPELAARSPEVAGLDNVIVTGAVPHETMPACLAAADIGVAPFEIGAHAPLSLGFYWSPLKIFEYMAAGLPVVAPRIDRIPALVEDGREGRPLRPVRARRPDRGAREADRPARCAGRLVPRLAPAPCATTAGRLTARR